MLKEGCANNEAMHSLKQMYSSVWKTKGIRLQSVSCFPSMHIPRTICTEGEKQVSLQFTEIMDNAQSPGTLWQPRTSTGFTQIVPIYTHTQSGPSAPEFPPPPRVFTLQVAFKAHLHLWVAVTKCHAGLYLSPYSSYVTWYFSLKKPPQTNRNF